MDRDRRPYNLDDLPIGNMSAEARQRWERREFRRKWRWAPLVSLLLLACLWYGVKGDSQTTATVCEKIPNGLLIVTSDETFKISNIFWAMRWQKDNAKLYAQIQEGKTYYITYEGTGMGTPHNVVRVSEAPASEARGTCPGSNINQRG